jgi:hypothetical protein
MNEVQSQEKIVHLDEMSQEDFDRFAASGSYEISEKIDGQNMSFGVDADGRFFTKTKRSDPVYDPSFYDEIPYLSGFGDFHRAVEDKKLVELMKESGETIQVFAELLPYAHSNTIEYSDEAVGENGAAVVFNVESSDEKFEGKIEFFAGQLSVAADGFKIYGKEIVDTSLKLAEGDDPEAVKAELIKKLNLIHSSLLGADKPEGYVIRNEQTGQIVKLVDKSEFTEQNKKNHKFSNKIQKANRRFKVNVRQQVFENADVLTQFEKAKEKVADEVAVRKQKGEGGYNSLKEILGVLVRDMGSEGHVPNFKEAAEIVTRQYVNWNEKVVEAENGFKESDSELSEISKDVTRHKIDSSKRRIDEIVEAFASEADWTALVRASLGPTRVRRLRKQFLE